MSNADPLVSILIPGFKPQWLDLCITSCLLQSYKNIEILIGDDTLDETISAVASKWLQNNVRIYKNKNKHLGEINKWNLLKHSKGQYIKFVYDDDFLFPESVEILLRACQKHHASMAFHYRQPIDADGLMLEPLKEYIVTDNATSGANKIISPSSFFQNCIIENINYIGEPSNCMFERNLLLHEQEHLNLLFNRKVRFLGDVKSYLNAAISTSPIIFVNSRLSAVRRHNKQASNSKIRPAGFYEWEVLKRYCFENGYLSESEFQLALKQQANLYGTMPADYPLLKNFKKLRMEQIKKMIT